MAAKHEKAGISTRTVIFYFSRLPQRAAVQCISMKPFETAAMSKRGKHNEEHMQIKEDKKATSIQAATVSAHCYEIMSSNNAAKTQISHVIIIVYNLWL